MARTDYGAIFDAHFLLLTDEERRYLALDGLRPEWKRISFYSNTNGMYNWVEAYFDGDTIVKVIQESRSFLRDGSPCYNSYMECDTDLKTEDGMLIPLTGRGKLKKLTGSNIMAVTPFGCSLDFQINRVKKRTELFLDNLRANQRFPLGEWERIGKIDSDGAFHEFMDWYISTCRPDYFEKLERFRRAQKVTVRYRPGDIFRMELDRERYCYGIITGTVRQFLKMPELPEKHSLRRLMMVPIMVRTYQFVTEDPGLTARDLEGVPLGRMATVGDNDIIWGTHPIVDHKALTQEDLEFHLVCAKIKPHEPHSTLLTQDMLMWDGLMKKETYSLYVEWGFARTELPWEYFSERLRALMEDYTSPHGGVSVGIIPRFAVESETPNLVTHRMDLLNPCCRELREELLRCLGLEQDTDFDGFARAFGGLTKAEILNRMK